jgi:putative transposase
MRIMRRRRASGGAVPEHRGRKICPMSASRIGRRSIRLAGYDYTRPGWYFVTIGTFKRQPILCAIVRGKVVPTEAGRIVACAWFGLPERFPNVVLDAFTIMPDHLHGLLRIRRAGYPPAAPLAQFGPSAHGSLGVIVGSLKSAATRQIRLACCTSNRIWHRNYHERIVSDADGVQRVRRYIRANPVVWERRHGAWRPQSSNLAVDNR